MSELTGPSKGAKSGDATSLVVFLHGYGADGNDLIGIADVLTEHLPDTRFEAPNAPERCNNNPMGYQWFPIPWMDGSSEVEAGMSMARSVDLLGGYFDGLEAATGIGPDKTVLFGFSQGTMMSLHVGLRRAVPFAGIAGFSGRLLQPEKLADEITVKPPVLLVHGDQDPVVPPSSMGEAETALKGAGVDVKTHMSPGVPHGIGPDGLTLALQFIAGHLGVGQG